MNQWQSVSAKRTATLPLSHPATQIVKWPLISIVTPSYNQGRFLEQTIHSILSQGYPNLEYFIMDGLSTDDSVAVIERYARNLSGWVSERDAGQSDAINKGWHRTKGEILAYLNSDDLYLPHTLSRVAEYFTQHPECDIVYGALQIIDEQGNPQGKPVHVPQVNVSWLLKNPLPQPTMFLRRHVLDRVGFLDTSLHYVFDWDFCLRAALEGLCFQRLSGAPLAAFRSWPGQKTAESFERHIAEQFQMRDRLLEKPLTDHLAEEVLFSKAWAFLWPAYQCYIHERMAQARRYLNRAVGTHRAIAVHPEFLNLYVRTLLGSRFWRYVRALKMRWAHH